MPAADPVTSAERIAAQAAALAPEAEQARRLPAALVEAIAHADLFRLCVPASAGGLEAHPATFARCVEALARGDGAAGWCLAVQATAGLLAGYMQPEAAAEIFGTPGSIAGGVFAPRGHAAGEDGGLRAGGRWPFASGCEHADWLCGGCVVSDGGSVRSLANGSPDIHLLFAPRAEVAIHDTWHVAGLRGTGSHDIEFDGLLIPAGRAVSVFSAPPREAGTLFTFPFFGLLAVSIAAVSLGIARGALDELLEVAAAKTPTGSRRVLAKRDTVQADVARAEAALRAARSLLFDEIDRAWDQAAADGSVAIDRRTGLRLAATHAVAAGAQVAQEAYRLAGGSAIYESSPLQRRFRDANVATQHMLVGPATWELSGRLLLGEATDITQL